MRISTQQYFDTSSAKYQDNYSGVVKAQDQASSGVRVQTASDDPVAAAQLLMLQQQKDMLGQYNTNITTLQNSLTNEESVLQSINTALQTAQGLAQQAGNIAKSDDDRKAIAAQVGALEDQVLGLLNSKDSSGNYMFSGAKTDTPPYIRNNDGTYSYQGDETPLSLQISNNLSISMGDTGKALLESSSNTGRTQATLLPPSVNDGKVGISAGLVTSSTKFANSFSDGQPYKLTFASSTQYSVTDKDGNDVTSEITGNGTFDSTKEGSSSVSLRGVTFDIRLNLGKDVASGPASDALVAGKEFSLATKPDSFSISRTASNPSTAQLTGGSVTDPAAYTSTFPNSGAVIRFTSGTDYQVFAQPYSADSKAIASGTMAAGAASITTVGLTFGVSGTPGAGDQFSVGATSNKNMNALDTLGQLRKALETPAEGNTVALNNLKDVVATSIGNLGNASAQIDQVRGAIGARQNAMDIQSAENTSLGLANTSTMSSLANVDMGQAAIDLTLQQTMLQASQLAFVKISQLSLFSKM